MSNEAGFVDLEERVHNVVEFAQDRVKVVLGFDTKKMKKKKLKLKNVTWLMSLRKLGRGGVGAGVWVVLVVVVSVDEHGRRDKLGLAADEQQALVHDVSAVEEPVAVFSREALGLELLSRLRQVPRRTAAVRQLEVDVVVFGEEKASAIGGK